MIVHMQWFTNCELYYHEFISTHSFWITLLACVKAKESKALHMKAELRRWEDTEVEPKQEEDTNQNLADRISKSKPLHLCCKIMTSQIT